MRTSNSDPYLVVIDPAGTNSQAKREAATQRGQTPERRRRGDEEYETWSIAAKCRSCCPVISSRRSPPPAGATAVRKSLISNVDGY